VRACCCLARAGDWGALDRYETDDWYRGWRGNRIRLGCIGDRRRWCYLLLSIGVGPFSEGGYAANEIKRLEKELGISCQTVEDRALRFITENISILRTATKNKKPWVSENRSKFLDDVALLKEQTSKCCLIQTQAQAGKLPYPGEYRKQHSILRSLGEFVTVSYKFDPNDDVMREVFMESLEKEYNDLTIGSSKRPQAGVADPKR